MKKLADSEYKVFLQSGEDGVIDEIFSRNKILRRDNDNKTN